MRYGTESFRRYTASLHAAFLIAVVSLAAFSEPEVPRAWREYVKYDQEYNVGRGPLLGGPHFYPLDKEKRAPVPIYHIDVPLWAVSVHESKYLDAETKKWAYHEDERGIVHARLYFFDPASPELVSLAKQHGPIQQTLWGVRLQSHSTHLVWDPKTEESAFIKMAIGSGVNWRANLASTIKINDFVEEKLAQNPQVAGSILTERFGVQVRSTNETSHVNIIRAMKPNKVTPPGEVVLVPAHGFLSSPLIDEAARAMGIDRLTYIKTKYAPRLARHLAEWNYGLGLYPEAHTQNVLLWWNRKTGEIEEFVHRDMTDMAVDTAIEVVRKQPPSSRGLFSTNVSRLNRHHVGLQKEHKEMDWAFGPAFILGSYVHEHFWTIDRYDLAAVTKLFIDEYVKASEQVSGVKLDYGRMPEVEASPYEFGGRFVYSALYQQIMQSYFPPLDVKRQKKWLRAEPELAELFLSYYERGASASIDPAFRLKLERFREAFVLNPRPKKDFTFGYQDGKVFAYESGSGRVLAFAHGISDSERIPYEGYRFQLRCFLHKIAGRLQTP